MHLYGVQGSEFASWKQDGTWIGGETAENTAFMWRQLNTTSVGKWLSKDSGKLTVITDRGTAILKGLLDTMPHVDVVFCAFHIIANINKHCKGDLPIHSFSGFGLTPVLLSANGAPVLQKTGSRTNPATEPMFWAAQVSDLTGTLQYWCCQATSSSCGRQTR